MRLGHRQPKFQVNALDLLVLATLPHHVLVSRLAVATRVKAPSAQPDLLRLSRQLYVDPCEQGRLILEVNEESRRQSALAEKRRAAAALLPRPSVADRRTAIARKVLGHSSQWCWRNMKLSCNTPASVEAHWLRIHDGVIVVGAHVRWGVFKVDTFLYKVELAGPTHCVTLPVKTKSLAHLFDVLGLHKRTLELADVVVDWNSKSFSVNGRDIIPWNYT